MCKNNFFFFSNCGLFSRDYLALFLLTHSVRWKELRSWFVLIYLESAQNSCSKSFDARSWIIREYILSSAFCVQLWSARLMADSGILWCLKHSNNLHCRLYCADVSILHSNRQWSIVSFLRLQDLQRGGGE